MKIVGLITEYNPFHNGHKYHIEKALEISNADAALVIMSGDHVQRGAPAILPKHIRAEMALRNGASIVLELPACYATGSAEYFAEGAVSILHNLGCIDSICFGSECADISILTEIAHILVEEPNEFQTFLQDYLRKGLPFPLARQEALISYTGNPEYAAIISKPNNTLGLEYLKALIRLDSPMKAYTIQRVGAGYHEENLHETFSSASAIRSRFQARDFSFEDLASHVPDSVSYLLEKNYLKRFPIEANDYSLLLKYKLLSETKETLLNYADMSEEIANRILNKRNQFTTWTDFCDLLKTKEVTYARISRVLLHIVLGIYRFDKKDTFYARILGFRRDDRGLLRMLKDYSKIPLITKLSTAPELSDSGTKMLTQDIFASDLYESVIADKFHKPFMNEHQKQIVIQ